MGALDIVIVRQGEAFSSQYVRMLGGMLPNPICLTDRADTPGRARPLETDLQGWWAKMELFAPWNRDLRPFFYLDLDSYVLGDISDIMENPGEELWLIDDFYDPGRGQTGLMIVPKDTDHIWEAFKLLEDLLKFGDAEFVRTFAHRRLNKIYGGVRSYKTHNLVDSPKDARIVCFHGRPKPHQIEEGWAKEVYERA